MVKNSKPVAYERKNPRTHCSGTKGYAITVWQEVHIDWAYAETIYFQL
jgi:hypothetical protein